MKIRILKVLYAQFLLALEMLYLQAANHSTIVLAVMWGYPEIYCPKKLALSEVAGDILKLNTVIGSQEKNNVKV